MSEDVYAKLAVALDHLPNGFPRTPSNVELKLLRRIFSTDEALIASHLTAKMKPIDDISSSTGLEPSDVKRQLYAMAKRELVWYSQTEEGMVFRLAPFVVGIFEAQLNNMDPELAQLCEDYLADGGAAGIMKYDPALHRVVPAQNSINAQWVMPYDDIKEILLKANSFTVRDCICRVQRDQLGKACDAPKHNCLIFNMRKTPTGYTSLAQEQALKLLDEAEEAGLVHTVSNVVKGVGYICNCCGCCCAILRGITEWGLDKSVAFANYYAVIDESKCEDCGICIDRCQVKAIESVDMASKVIREKCIGCGLCIGTCPEEAIELKLKPESEIVVPPEDFSVWEDNRLKSRGME
ncbi:MAG: 4Fe-4S binding protein [candidate division Zixibacteria bacterium]|nr:4Fe-4S binding protein [candidate division Zixibacteria bacterium]